MKRFVPALCFTLLAPALHAACTGDLPGNGVLDFHPSPSAEGVIGGVGPNQCGIEVTDFCSNGKCLAFFDGLSGYVDVSALASGTIDAPPDRFDYTVTSAEGSLTFMGQRQAFDISDNAPLQVVPQVDHVLLSLPDPLPNDIVMTSTGSSGWEAQLPDWVGVPVPVTIFLDRLGAADASLELFADSQLVKLDVRLKLARVGGPGLATSPAQPAPPEPDRASACDQADALAQSVGASKRQDLIDAYYGSVAQAGITDWGGRTELQCQELLRHLDANEIRPEVFATASSGQAVAPLATTGQCDELSARLRPILRGPATAERSDIMMAMVTAGVTSLVSATPDQCAAIAAVIR